MNDVRFVWITAGVLLPEAGATNLRRTRAASAVAPHRPQDAACVSYVPRGWGQYKGGSSQSGRGWRLKTGTGRCDL